MTVRERIEENKKNASINDIIAHLIDIADYGGDTYAKPLDEEYRGDYEDEMDDPWIQDILYCEMAIEFLKKIDD